MPWYGWLGWILMLCAIGGILIYFLVRKKQPANLAEAKLKLREIEDELKKTKTRLVEETLAKKQQEKEKAKIEMELIEVKYKEQLETLKGKEREDYEKAKTNPETGVNFMRDFLNTDTDRSKSGP